LSSIRLSYLTTLTHCCDMLPLPLPREMPTSSWAAWLFLLIPQGVGQKLVLLPQRARIAKQQPGY
jgi:hypothetical protein